MAAVAALRRAMLAVSARDWEKGMKPCRHKQAKPHQEGRVEQPCLQQFAAQLLLGQVHANLPSYTGGMLESGSARPSNQPQKGTRPTRIDPQLSHHPPG